jgi:hypothetical protein
MYQLLVKAFAGQQMLTKKIDYFALVIHKLLQGWGLRHKIFYKKDENQLDCGAGAHKKMTTGIPGESGKPVVICTFGES